MIQFLSESVFQNEWRGYNTANQHVLYHHTTGQGLCLFSLLWGWLHLILFPRVSLLIHWILNKLIYNRNWTGSITVFGIIRWLKLTCDMSTLSDMISPLKNNGHTLNSVECCLNLPKRHKDNTNLKLYSKSPKIRNRIQLGGFTSFFNWP